MRRAVPVFFFLFLSLLPQSTLRAQAATSDSVPPDTLPVFLLPGIEVEVVRAPIPLDRTPVSVSVLGARGLTVGTSGTSLEETLQGLPGLQIQNRYNFSTGERIILRGQGARTQFGLRGLRVTVDGIPATLPDGQATLDHLDFLSLGRVEILRGPAAAVYGNGAAGVLRFASRPPAAEPFRLEALVQGGSHGLRRTGGLASGRAGDVGYLISAGYLGWNGYRTDPISPEGTYGGVRRWNAHGTLGTPLAGGRLGVTLNLLDQNSENPGSLSRSLLSEDPLQAYPFNRTQQTGEEARQAAIGISFQRPWKGVFLNLATHGLARDLWNPIPPAIIDLARESGGLLAEVRGASKGSRVGLDWLFGMEMAGQWDNRKNFQNQEGVAGTLTLDQRETVRSLGGYLQGQLHLWERVDLLGALRADRIRFEARDGLVASDNPDDSGTRTMEALSPMFGVWLPLFWGLGLRGSTSSFFQTPTTSELANRPDGAGGMNPALDPERGWTLEAGITSPAGRALQVEVAYFRTRVEDQLIPFEVPSAPGRSFYRNAGESRIRGLEISAFGSLPLRLRFRGAYTWTDARFREFSVAGRSLKGKRIPGVSSHRVDGLVRWEARSSDPLPNGFMEARLLYNGAVPVDDENSDQAGPYALVDLRLGIEGWTLASRDLSVFGGITNLLDRSYTTAVAVNAFGGRFFEPGPGRSGYVGLRTVLFP